MTLAEILASPVNARSRLIKATDTGLTYYIAAGAASSTAQVHSTTAASVDGAIATASEQQDQSIRGNLAVKKSSRAAFVEDFRDVRRWPDFTPVVHNVSMPLVTTMPSDGAWRVSYSGSPADQLGNRVMGGAMITLRQYSPYVGANAIVEDTSDFSIAWMFTRTKTGFASGTDPTLTVNVGAKDVVSPASGINPNGKMHINMTAQGISQPSFFFGNTVFHATAQAATDDVFTSVGPHTFETYDLVTIVTVLAGNSGGLMPGGIAAGGGGANVFNSLASYYVVKLNDTTFKLATSRANVLAGVFVDVTSAGTQLRFKREGECINRDYENGLMTWLPKAKAGLVVSSVDATNNYLTFANGHGLTTGDKVILEGVDLPLNVAEKTLYEAVYVNGTQISLRTLAGAAVDFADIGSGDMWVHGQRRQLATSMHLGLPQLLVMRIKGDFVDFELVGVGVIRFYIRNLNALMFTTGKDVSFYWQTGGSMFDAVRNRAIYGLNAVCVDAPEVEAAWRDQALGYAASFAENLNILPSPAAVVDPGTRAVYSSSWGANGGAAKYGFAIGASGTAVLDDGSFVPINGNAWCDGFYQFTLGAITGLGAPASFTAPGAKNLQLETTLASVTRTNGSPNISFAQNNEIAVNMLIYGTGIPAGAYVAARSNTTATLSANANGASVVGTGTNHCVGYRSVAGNTNAILFAVDTYNSVPRGTTETLVYFGTLTGTAAKRLMLTLQFFTAGPASSGQGQLFDSNIPVVVTPDNSTITSGSAVATMASTAGLSAGMTVMAVSPDTGIPEGARILTVDSGTQITMTVNATVTNTGTMQLAFGNSPLDAVTGVWKLEIKKFTSGQFQMHFATFTLPNGTQLPTQRFATFQGANRGLLEFRCITTDGGGIVVDAVDNLATPVRLR
jgi:hypothetical protein